MEKGKGQSSGCLVIACPIRCVRNVLRNRLDLWGPQWGASMLRGARQ